MPEQTYSPNIGIQTPVTKPDPVEAATLSAQHLRAYTRQDEDVPELVIHDGENEVTVSHEVGRLELAVLGFKRLGDAAYAHAHLLEQRHARSQGYS